MCSCQIFSRSSYDAAAYPVEPPMKSVEKPPQLFVSNFPFGTAPLLQLGYPIWQRPHSEISPSLLPPLHKAR